MFATKSVYAVKSLVNRKQSIMEILIGFATRYGSLLSDLQNELTLWRKFGLETHSILLKF